MSKTGTVKFFNGNYGFIEPKDGGGDDDYVRRSNVDDDPNRLQEGTIVEYDIGPGEKGPQAINVSILGTGSTGNSGSTQSGGPKGRSGRAPLSTGLRVPRDSEPHLKQRHEIENPALYLHKAVSFERDDDGGFEVEHLPDTTPRVPRHVVERVRGEYNELLQAHPTVEVRSLRRCVDWRMVIGLGQFSAYETNMTLHHVYGMPYVPGSGLKGTVRSYVLITSYWDANLPDDGEEAGKKLEERALNDPLFCTLFGCPPESAFGEARRGQVRFFDAYPAETPTVEADIMNPHFKDYYMDKEPPTDDQDPNPVRFMTVKDTSFTFWVGEEHDADAPVAVEGATDSPLYKQTPDEHRTSLLDLATHWLERTLTEYGVGAKTAVGYGYFNDEGG